MKNEVLYNGMLLRNNRNILECKSITSAGCPTWFCEIIETYWNVNRISNAGVKYNETEIIETYWNVNTEKIGYPIYANSK